MPARNDLSPIRFSDFTPGIRDNPGAGYPTGTATRDNTMRCIALPGGGLTPLPRRSTIYQGNDFLGANPAGGGYAVSGMFVTGGVSPLVGTFSGQHAEMFLASEYMNGGNRNFNFERLRLDETPVVRETIKNVVYGDPTADISGWGITWGVTRSNKATPLDPGVPVVVFAWAPVRVVAPGGFFVATFPDDATPTLNTPYVLPVVDAEPQICVHQGRIIIHQVTAYSHGAQTAWQTSENVRYTDVYNPSIVSAIFNYVPENPNGYAFMASMSANELFALKRSGAVVITGDLVDPLVTNLPMVPGSRDSHRPAHTPLGLVYGSRDSGIWVWAHSDGAQHLSPYMTPDFWNITEIAMLGAIYQFEGCERWILAPNNWLYSIDTQSWWRLDDPAYATIRFFSRFDNVIYGAITSYTHTNKNAVFSWLLDAKSSAWSWQSQPVWSTLDRVVEVREIELEAKGQGTVTVTSYGPTGTPITSSFTLANTGYPERLRANHTNKVQGLQIKITADSGNTSIDAPTVYAVSVLHRDQEHLAVT